MAESMRGLKRTCRCAELSEENIGQEVTVMGWVQKARNTGGLIFVDLRDRSGLLQINFQEEKLGQELFDKAYKRVCDRCRWYCCGTGGWHQQEPSNRCD